MGLVGTLAGVDLESLPVRKRRMPLWLLLQLIKSQALPGEYSDLWQARIRRAVRDCCGMEATSDQTRRARAWWFSRDFRDVCELIGLEPQWVQKLVYRFFMHHMATEEVDPGFRAMVLRMEGAR